MSKIRKTRQGLILAFYLVYSITALSYMAQKHPSYDDYRRNMLLYMSIIVIVLSGYNLSVQIYKLKTSPSKKQSMFNIFYNAVNITGASIILSYVIEDKCSYAKKGDWRKATITFLSLIVLSMSITSVYNVVKDKKQASTGLKYFKTRDLNRGP